MEWLRKEMEWLRKLLGADLWTGLDQRKNLRARCRLELQVQGGHWSLKASTRDIGPSGIRLEGTGSAPASLKRGAGLTLQHPEPPQQVQHASVRARVVWVKRRETAFQFACSFDEEPDLLKDSWVRPILVQALQGSVRQKRHYRRVRLDWLVEATINQQPEEVRLRDLSLSGCRFEITRELNFHDKVVLQLKELKVPCEIRRVDKLGHAFLVGVRFQAGTHKSPLLIELLKKLSTPL